MDFKRDLPHCAHFAPVDTQVLVIIRVHLQDLPYSFESNFKLKAKLSLRLTSVGEKPVWLGKPQPFLAQSKNGQPMAQP
jgi:hypothetical protein